MIYHNQPCLGAAESLAVADILNSGRIATGDTVREFESRFAGFVGRRFGLAVNSGSTAILLALKALGVGRKDEVILPTYVCSAVLNGIRALGGLPRLVDVAENSVNIDMERVERKITRRTRCVILPHMYGVPAPVDPQSPLGIPVIEDCAQCFGMRYRGRGIGTFGDISVFSFYATKLMTTGQGGMLLTDDASVYDFLRDITDYDCRSEYRVRYNVSMTDFQAAMGLAQLNRVERFFEKRKRIADFYRSVLESADRTDLLTFDAKERICYRFVLDTDAPDRWIRFFEQRGITLINPLERYELLHRYLGMEPAGFPNSEGIVDRTVSLPLYPSLDQESLEYIGKTIKAYLSETRGRVQ
ncbi:MAG: DegT/DnrJ/EryC1/StrS family aminotransferase [Desulfobacterales bacterium]|nr:DegT/DnrJ/EryC1/StrS family aminotransferase [Desulfobacterales bacterium]